MGKKNTNKPVGDRISTPNPNFRCHGNKGRPHNILHGSIEPVIPIKAPNIYGISAIQADL